MILDPHRRITFGLKEWIAVLTMFVTPTVSFGLWVWGTSDRVLLIEQQVNKSTVILERLDNARVDAASDRATTAQRLHDVERRLGSIEDEISK